MRKVLFVLGQLSDTDADWLSRHGQRKQISAGTVLIKQGIHLETIYIVLEGSMLVLAGRETKLATIGSGEILGEMSLIDSSPTTASVVAERASVVLAVPKTLLQQKLDVDAQFAARFYRAMCLFMADRMRSTISRLGYGSSSNSDVQQAADEELDADVLGRVHLAGSRFERMLKRLSGG
jgi:CRP/FNR family transcriptional regulator, cyclic AMP receptor protein